MSMNALAAGVRHQHHQVPLVLSWIADQDVLGTARPHHVPATVLDHLETSSL